MKYQLLLISGALLLAVSCGTDDPPVITSVSVSPTTVAAGGETTLTIDVGNFKLRPPSDHMGHGLSPAEEGHGEAEAGDFPDGGHFHVYLDDTMTNPLEINCPDHCKHPAWMPTQKVTIPEDATLGERTIIVRLNHDDHKTITPHIKAETKLTVTSSSS